MATTVNDGSVKWQAIKFSEADTLGGLTATDIKSQAISGKVVQTKGMYGSFGMSYKDGNAPTYTIPLPSGFTRSQCAYIITEKYSSDNQDSNPRFIQTTMGSVNQSNGVVTATVANGGRYGATVSITVGYVVIAAK